MIFIKIGLSVNISLDKTYVLNIISNLKGGVMRLISLLMSLGIAGLLYANWQYIGPPGGQLYTMAISPVNENMVYAGSYSSPTKIFRSTNKGITWTEVGSFGSYCYTMTVSQSGVIYAGYYGSIYKSTDNGATWIPSSVGNVGFYDLEAHPTDPNTIYGCGYRYVSGSDYAIVFIKTTNAGNNWSTVDVYVGGYSYGYGISVDRNNPNVIYVGGSVYSTTYEPRIFKSTNGGNTFTQVYSSTAGYYVYDVAVNPANSNIVYACTYYDGIYRSTDAGQNWTKVSSAYYNYRLGVSPANPNYVYCSGIYYFYRSTDAGETWTDLTASLPANYHYGLAVSRTNHLEVLVGNRAGAFKTTNGGTNWIASNDGINLGLPVVAATAAPSTPTTVYIQVEDVGVYKTTNCGSSWILCPSFSSCGDMASIAVKYNDPNYVMAIEGLG